MEHAGQLPDFNGAHIRRGTAQTFEIGIKSELLGRRLIANVAAFSTNYENVQLLLQVGINPRIDNFGTARIQGIEADFVAKVTDNFTVNASFGLMDSKLQNLTTTSAANSLQLGIVNGAELLKVPKFTANITPRLELPIGEHSFVILADYTYRSSMWNDSQRSFLLKRPSTNMINASIQFNHKDGWSLTGGVTNLTEQRYIVNGLTSTAGQIYAIPNRPREFYARLGFKF